MPESADQVARPHAEAVGQEPDVVEADVAFATAESVVVASTGDLVPGEPGDCQDGADYHGDYAENPDDVHREDEADDK